MSVPFVHSNYPRVEGDYYPTIDERCIDGFLQYFQPEGAIVDPCAPTGSGIVDVLLKRGHQARGLPDAFAESIAAEWILTNPPYKRPLVDDIINRQIERVAKNEVDGLAVLLRSNFDFAKSRAAMFAHPFYYGQIKLRFRPWWSEDRKAQPIHNYVWHIWKRVGAKNPIVLYSEGR